ncbi:hypothetical protein LTR53_019208, partial [Teratosphaeriaceae sp. CCFEE 6253]
MSGSGSSAQSSQPVTIDDPRQAVLETTELLEHILIHLPVATLFTVQQVCRQSQNLIATSPQLRMRLFLRAPDPTAMQLWVMIERPRNFTTKGLAYGEALLLARYRPASPIELSNKSSINKKPVPLFQSAAH